MQAYFYETHGKIALREISDPTPHSNQLLIIVKSFGLNRADLIQRSGKYPPPPGESEIPGLEVAGVVEKDFPGSRFHVGDRVMALLASGGYAEKVVVDEGLTLKLPPAWSFEEGAATPEAFLTAHHNLFTLGEVRAGERVLIHAGGSGVGTAALQLLRESGASSWATVGDLKKAAIVETLGAKPILYKQTEFAEEILKQTEGRGVDLILDCVGASYLTSNLTALAQAGRIVCIGTLGGAKGEIDLRLLLRKRARLIGSTLRALPIEEKRLVVKRFAENFYDALLQKQMAPILHKVFPACEILKAQEEMERNANTGKIVLRWESR